MSEYLDEEEQIARMRSWWDENGTSVIVGIVLAVVGVVGWNWYGAHRDSQIESAAKHYADFLAATGEARDAARAALAAEHDGSAYHVFAEFHQVQELIAAGDAAAAKSILESIVNTADDALLVDLARIRLAKVHQELGASSLALEVLAEVRNAGYKPLALEVQGDIHMAMNDLEAAHQSYTAAKESLLPGDDRPLLEMKLSNAAPFNGEYVALSDPLTDALREAQESLESDAAAELVTAAEEDSDTDVD